MSVVVRVLAEIQRALKYGLVGAMALLALNTAAFLVSTTGGQKFAGWFGQKVHDDKLVVWMADRARPAVLKFARARNIGQGKCGWRIINDEDRLMARVPPLVTPADQEQPATAADSESETGEQAAAAEPKSELLLDQLDRLAASERRNATYNESWQAMRSDVQSLWTVLLLAGAGFILGLAAWLLRTVLLPGGWGMWLAGAILLAVVLAGALLSMRSASHQVTLRPLDDFDPATVFVYPGGKLTADDEHEIPAAVTWGKLKDRPGEEDPPAIQSMRFSAAAWSADDVSSWLDQHGIKSTPVRVTSGGRCRLPVLLLGLLALAAWPVCRGLTALLRTFGIGRETSGLILVTLAALISLSVGYAMARRMLAKLVEPTNIAWWYVSTAAGFLFWTAMLVLLIAVIVAWPICRRACCKTQAGDSPPDGFADKSKAEAAETHSGFAIPAVWPLVLAVAGGLFHGYVLAPLAVMMTSYVRRNRWVCVLTIAVAAAVAIGWAYGTELWWVEGWSKHYPWARPLYILDALGGDSTPVAAP